ncbi:hypothetical protein BEN47_11650 [Hymenobacter lapidarius]|uniref:Uncharacterized protein n=1 Tax=Hymenobacter lapidarius TaxID=1908237 RepID=A0A1G1T8E2_9BACT|nr:hypothetical protein BEN47_11650 [Hymenobacter lapidarius]
MAKELLFCLFVILVKRITALVSCILYNLFTYFKHIIYPVFASFCRLFPLPPQSLLLRLRMVWLLGQLVRSPLLLNRVGACAARYPACSRRAQRKQRQQAGCRAAWAGAVA